MKKSELIQIIKEEIKKVIKETKGIDSRYFQKSLDDIIHDVKRNEPQLAKVLTYIKSRLNQSYPNDDITQNDINDILNDPRIKNSANNVSDEIQFHIDSIFNN